MYGIVCLFWTSLSFSLTLILDLISFEILSVSFQWQFKRNIQFLNGFFLYTGNTLHDITPLKGLCDVLCIDVY